MNRIRPSAEAVLLLISKAIITSVWLKKHLKGAFHVIHETSGKKAMERLKNSTVDFVILDENVKDGEPFALAQQIKNHLRPDWIPILLITANLKRAYQDEAYAAGITDFLSDPLEEEELETRIAISLKIREMHDKIADVSRSLKEKNIKRALDSSLSKRFILNNRAIYEVAKAKREKKPLTIALIRIDAFKEMERKCDLLEIDRLLLSLSEFLIREIRKEDILIPTKDGKFILIMPSTSLNNANHLAKILIDHINQEDFRIAKEALSLSVSVVLTSQDIVSRDSEKDFEHMVESADKMMKKVKQRSQLISVGKEQQT